MVVILNQWLFNGNNWRFTGYREPCWPYRNVTGNSLIVIPLYAMLIMSITWIELTSCWDCMLHYLTIVPEWKWSCLGHNGSWITHCTVKSDLATEHVVSPDLYSTYTGMGSTLAEICWKLEILMSLNINTCYLSIKGW